MRSTGFYGRPARVPGVPADRPALLRQDPRRAAARRGPSSPRPSTARSTSTSAAPRASASPSARCRPTRRRSTPPAGAARASTSSNTYDLPSRALYGLTALTLHESAPGHAFQIPLAEERRDLPDFRRKSYISAYGEGWAVYCERLGAEMGMYPTPYDTFGMLSYQAWRASRLVVDTGLHHLGWDPRPGPGLPPREHRALRTTRSRRRCGPLHLLAGPGFVLLHRRGGVLARAPQGRGGAGRALQHSRLPRRGAGAGLGPPCRCWRRGSTASSPRAAAAPTPTRSREPTAFAAPGGVVTTL